MFKIGKQFDAWCKKHDIDDNAKTELAILMVRIIKKAVVSECDNALKQLKN